MPNNEKPIKLTDDIWTLAEVCFQGVAPLVDVIKARSPKVEASIINLAQAFDRACQIASTDPENSQALEEQALQVQEMAQALKTAILAEVRNDIQGMPEPGSEDDALGYVHSAPPGDNAIPKTRFDLRPGHTLEAAVPLSGVLRHFNKTGAERGVDLFSRHALIIAKKNRIPIFQHQLLF